MSDLVQNILKNPDQGVDFIGDIHGHHDQLLSLLENLGYRLRDGAYRHSNRIVIFLGDYIDRGPAILQTLKVVRRMVEQKSAIALMGNHEYNALAWCIPRSERGGIPCRRHTPDRKEMFHETQVQLGDSISDWIEWFRTLPLFINHPRFKAVHASWDLTAIAYIQKAISNANGVFDDNVMRSTCIPGTAGFTAIERLLKGPEVKLPNGIQIRDAKGVPRSRIRIRWFDTPTKKTYQEYALTHDEHIPNIPLPTQTTSSAYPLDAPPVFFGHYWMTGTSPAPLRGNVACLDYSVALGGPMVGYRFDGECDLDAAKFVTS